jgi:sugar O-acyltransferase (sialic acid O-acetyltransferase NeuD family)
MLIAGAGGHAVELINILEIDGYSQAIFALDEIQQHAQPLLGVYSVLHSTDQVKALFATNKAFALGVGKPWLRKAFTEKLEGLGGELQSIISSQSSIGGSHVILGSGLNILQGAVITQRISIGKGSLVHIHCSIHHDVEIGEFCELSPGCRILGSVKIGSMVSIGANATILPGINVGEGAVVGTGAVVTKDVAPYTKVAGVPAKPMKK